MQRVICTHMHILVFLPTYIGVLIKAIRGFVKTPLYRDFIKPNLHRVGSEGDNLPKMILLDIP